MRRYTFVLFLAVILIFACSQKQESHKIGVVLSLCGKGAVYGERSLNGMKIAQEELNKLPYFQKTPINLIVEDSRSKPSDALLAFNKLISYDKVGIVLGMVLSDEVLTCAPTANKNKIVLFSPGAGSTKITEAGPYICRNRESAEIQAGALANACIKMNLMKVAILYSQAANGVSYKNAFKKEFSGAGGKVISEIAFIEGVNDYRPEIQKAVNSKPDAVYLAGLDREIGLLLKQARGVNFNMQFFASAGAVSPKLLEIAGESAEGLISVSASFDPNDNSRSVTNFVDAYKAKYKVEPEWVAANSYEALKIMGSLIESGDRTGEEIKKGLDNLLYEGFSGKLKFDSKGEVQKTPKLLSVINGKFSTNALEE